MPRILKIALYILGGLVLVILVAGFAFSRLGASRANATFQLPDEPVVLPLDSASVENGARLATLLGCVECHGEGLAGKLFLDGPPFAVLSAPNLTAGAGGVGGSYAVVDWERAIRHGVDRRGRGILIMPSAEYSHLTDTDVADVIVYLQSLPAVDGEHSVRDVRIIGRFILAAAQSLLMEAARIDHSAPHPATIEAAVTPEFGEYLSRTCAACHGPDFAGAPPLSGDIDVSAANLTPDSSTGLGEWNRDEFVTVMRTGVRPDGRQLDPVMPWPAFANFTDVELDAIWTYLRSLPAVFKEDSA